MNRQARTQGLFVIDARYRVCDHTLRSFFDTSQLIKVLWVTTRTYHPSCFGTGPNLQICLFFFEANAPAFISRLTKVPGTMTRYWMTSEWWTNAKSITYSYYHLGNATLTGKNSNPQWNISYLRTLLVIDMLVLLCSLNISIGPVLHLYWLCAQVGLATKLALLTVSLHHKPFSFVIYFVLFYLACLDHLCKDCLLSNITNGHNSICHIWCPRNV